MDKVIGTVTQSLKKNSKNINMVMLLIVLFIIVAFVKLSFEAKSKK